MSLSTNSRFGPYLVAARLGAGGMGEVYKARDERLGRDVALKVLRPDTSSEIDPQRRFAHEARAASSLNHPNILTVHDVGMESGVPYIVTELVDGEALDKILQKGPLPTAKVLELAIQIASGLVAAHRAGIVHRDLKPANLMLTRGGLVKILDFGLAKTLPGQGSPAGDSGVTHPGLVLGTASYMSPEQARGESVDFRSDQFSFGLILYEMLSGKRAFDRSTPVSTLSAIIEEDFEPLAATKPSIPAPLRWCVERCLAKDRDQRYADTQDLYHELKVNRDRAAEVGTLSAPVTIPRPRRRWRGTVLAFVLLLAVIATAGLASLRLIPHGVVDLTRYRLTPIATEGVFEGEPAWSPDGKNLAYSGEADNVRQIFVRRLGSPTAARITRSEVDCDMPFWSPDGTRIYFLSAAQVGWSLWSVAATGGAPRLVQEQVEAAAHSHDGSTLVFLRSNATNGSLALLYSVHGAPAQTYNKGPFSRPDYRMGHLAFSPDGRQLGAWLSHWSGRSDFWLIPWPSGEPVLALSLQQDAAPFNWMPDGGRILFGARMAGTTGADLHIADLESRRVFPLTKTSTEAVHPAVTWDGTRIAFTASNNDFDLVEMTLDGAPPKTVLATSRSETHPSWSPAGGQYAFVTDRTGSPQIWLKSKGDGWQRPLITEADFANSWVSSFEDTTFASDGQRIAYTVTGSKGHALYVSNVMGGPPLRLVTDNSDQRAPAWSPDGAWIVFVENASGRWSLAKVASGGADKALKIRSLPWPCDPQWSPKGDWITCVTEEGLTLISPDGSSTRAISRQNWLLQGWNRDGSAIYGVVQLPNRHRALAVIDVVKSTERIVTELPMAAATAIRGFSLSPEGDRFLTAVGRPRADIWVLEGFERPSMWKTLLGRVSR